jgi:phosphoserine phosphatase
MLVAFDFDGTLSDSEMMVRLGEEQGVAEEIADITERAMNDELSYAESLRERADLLFRLDEAAASRAFSRVELRPGSAEVVTALREAGHHVAILTGGFDRGVEAALAAAGVEVDTVVANHLVSRKGHLTGRVEGPLVEGTKDTALEDLAADLGVAMDDTVAVGDGANDLPMLEVAGLAVGYDPKPAVEPHCEVVVESMAELKGLFEDRGLL